MMGVAWAVGICLFPVPWCTLAAAGQQRPSLPTPQEGKYVEMIQRADGDPILVVHYPWYRHARPSVEVRFLYEDEVGERLIYPLYFLDRYMRGPITVALFRAQDTAENVPAHSAFTRNEIEFEIFADRNALGNAAVSVACRTKRVSLDQSRPTARVAFSLLDPWALNARTLYLRLPRRYFPDACKVRVWLMRGKDIVWAENADWPGYPAAAAEEGQ